MNGKGHKKRANGEGTYYQKGDRVCLKVRKNGRSKIFSGKTRAEAKRAYDEYQAKYGMLSGDGMLEKTFSDYMEFWMEHYKRTAVAAPTYDSIEDAWKRIQNYPVAHQKLEQVNTSSLQALLDSLADHYAESTVRKTWEWVNNCLKYAYETGLLSRDPTVMVHIPQAEHFEKETQEILPFTEEEQKRLEETALRTYKTGRFIYWYGPAFVLMLYTGLRPGELRGLRWKDILQKEIGGVTVTVLVVCGAIRESKNRGEEGGKTRVYLGATKNSNSIREIPLNARAQEMLEMLRKLCGSHTGPEDYIVQTAKHTMTDRGNLGRFYRSIARKAGIEGDGAMNRARHTFATNMVQNQVDVATTAKLMGHANPKTTLKYYADSDQEHAYEAVCKLN